MLEEVIEGTWPVVDLQAGPGQPESPHPLPVLGMYVPITAPTWEPFSRTQAGESTVLLSPTGLRICLNPAKVSM